jgi:hypothetical protein
VTKPKAPAPLAPADFWRDAYQLAKDIHEIEVRTLQGRIDDLTAQLASRPSLAEVNARMAGLMREEEEGPGKGKDDDENPLRKSNPVQWIMDSLEEVIPLGNENARQGVRTWVQRQIRLRGQGSIDEILEEAIQGDVTDEHEEEVEP